MLGGILIIMEGLNTLTARVVARALLISFCGAWWVTDCRVLGPGVSLITNAGAANYSDGV